MHMCIHCITYFYSIFQDELLAENEKVVLKVEDLLTWIVEDKVVWKHGRKAHFIKNKHQVLPPTVNTGNQVSPISLGPVANGNPNATNNAPEAKTKPPPSNNETLPSNNGQQTGCQDTNDVASAACQMQTAMNGSEKELVKLFSSNNLGLQLQEIKEMKQALGKINNRCTILCLHVHVH